MTASGNGAMNDYKYRPCAGLVGMARILLIHPPMYHPPSIVVKEADPVFPPMGLLYIASCLEMKNHEVNVLDLNVSSKNLKETLESYKPDFVGITSLSPQFPEAVGIASDVKSFNKETVTILGGAHANACGVGILKQFDQFDYVVNGEGEILMEKLASGAPPSAIEGLIFRQGTKIIDNGKTFVRDLDSLPFPARHLVEIDKYGESPLYYRREPHTTILTSRGCPFRCIYCDHVAKGPFRARSPANVITELEQLHSQGFRNLRIVDECFTFDQKRVRAICDMMVERKLDFGWICQTRADCFDALTLKKMKKAGCHLIQVGIETGSPRIMKRINKNLDLDKARLAIRMAKNEGMQVAAFFMMGFPFESRDDMRQTIEYAKSVDVDIATFSIVTPYPGTELASGLDFGSLEQLKTLLLYSENNPFFKTEGVEELFKKAIREFYFRPSVIGGILKEALTAGDLKRRTRYVKFLLYQLYSVLSH